MKAYYLVFFIMLLISWFYQIKDDKQWRWKLFWTFLPLFIYAAIRVDYGYDYPTYENLYNDIHSTTSFSLDRDLHAEIGYQLLNKMMPSFRLLLILNALILSLALGVFCYNNIPPKYLWLIIILIFLNPEKNIFGNLVGIRNGLVVTSFLLGFVFVQKRKLIPFAFLTIGLSTIHTSALLYMPIAYIAGINNVGFTKKELWIWLGAIVFLLGFSLSSLADVVAVLIDNEYFDRYQAYLDDGEVRRGGLLAFASLSFIFLYIFYLFNRSSNLTSSQNSLLRVGILYSVTMLMGSLSIRASYFYDMYLIGSAVLIFSDKKAPKWLRCAVLVLALVTSYYSMQVWMHSEWWDHGIYHSLIGNW